MEGKQEQTLGRAPVDSVRTALPFLLLTGTWLAPSSMTRSLPSTKARYPAAWESTFTGDSYSPHEELQLLPLQDSKFFLLIWPALRPHHLNQPPTP